VTIDEIMDVFEEHEPITDASDLRALLEEAVRDVEADIRLGRKRNLARRFLNGAQHALSEKTVELLSAGRRCQMAEDLGEKQALLEAFERQRLNFGRYSAQAKVAREVLAQLTFEFRHEEEEIEVRSFSRELQHQARLLLEARQIAIEGVVAEIRGLGKGVGEDPTYLSLIKMTANSLAESGDLTCIDQMDKRYHLWIESQPRPDGQRLGLLIEELKEIRNIYASRLRRLRNSVSD